MEKTPLTQEYVLSILEYRDGELYWKERPPSHFATEPFCRYWNRRYSGKPAGCCSRDYEAVAIDYIRYPAHRIIFLMHHGYLPPFVDHRDCNTKNNKIENLRAATKADNVRNRRLDKRNTSGRKGVYWHKRTNKWRAMVCRESKNIHLGYFTDLEEAAKVAREGREKFHGEFARHE